MPDGGSVSLRVFYTFPYFDYLNRSIGELIDSYKIETIQDQVDVSEQYGEVRALKLRHKLTNYDALTD